MRIVLSNNEGASGIGTSARRLAQGQRALDALEAGVRCVEADPSVWTVGRGGWPNLLGTVELDASGMDGDTLRTGSVGAVTGFLHPVSIARRVMEDLPHELLVGEGAMRFADHCGMERVPEVFPPVHVAMVRAGEAGGFLDVVL